MIAPGSPNPLVGFPSSHGVHIRDNAAKRAGRYGSRDHQTVPEESVP
jgi:hypothetical protein